MKNDKEYNEYFKDSTRLDYNSATRIRSTIRNSVPMQYISEFQSAIDLSLECNYIYSIKNSITKAKSNRFGSNINLMRIFDDMALVYGYDSDRNWHVKKFNSLRGMKL